MVAASEKERSKSAKELCNDKTRRIQRTNPGKRVRERSSQRNRWIGKRSGSRKPVRASYVEANCHRNRFGAKTGTAANDAEEPKSRNKFAEELTASGPTMMRDL